MEHKGNCKFRCIEQERASGCKHSDPISLGPGTADAWSDLAVEIKPAMNTPNLLQQKVTWNPSTYQAYEASDLGNVRFCADGACTTQLNARLESCTPSCTSNAKTYGNTRGATCWVYQKPYRLVWSLCIYTACVGAIPA